MTTPLLSVVMPMYQEARDAPAVLTRLLGAFGADLQVIVVDDGSTDDGIEPLPHDSRLTVVRHQVNRGKGAALRSGISICTGSIIAVHDMDAEYDPEDLKKLLQVFSDPQVFAVVGTRRQQEGWDRMRFLNRWGNRFLTGAFNLLHRTSYGDVTAGTKVFRASRLDAGQLQEEGWGIDVEILAHLTRAGVVLEQPVHYQPRGAADGKKIRARDGLPILATVWRLRRGMGRKMPQAVAARAP